MNGEKTFIPAVHTVLGPDGWTNECDVWPRARDPHSTREEAEAAGREWAEQEQTEHVVHGPDGAIERRTSYRDLADTAPPENRQ